MATLQLEPDNASSTKHAAVSGRVTGMQRMPEEEEESALEWSMLLIADANRHSAISMALFAADAPLLGSSAAVPRHQGRLFIEMNQT